MYVVPFDVGISYALNASMHLKTDVSKWRMTWVWNTGRCGSTLMHRMLSTQVREVAPTTTTLTLTLTPTLTHKHGYTHARKCAYTFSKSFNMFKVQW